ncbi:MlaD family protein [Mucilaginibacter myungsuensis]|uniref:MCE family protein n=1 Tax=Mucilaginibacter myungsuensis TaxID=649104 RepID=A0A929PV04_9SPHI|nr:MlaD family protein [Mucilaginibacter myungsuensis]MBE9660486.1 MCE family protein [Mucilaginibacter myungsuensis]MDN3600530.1 MlaD family protein [Mucilaginibacter myungsuensis]
MDPKENKRAITVGIFIFLGIALFVLGIFTLGNGQKSFGGGLNVSAVFNDVGGLKKGGAVWFSGVKVGNITDIRFTGPSEVTVKMTIDEKIQSYVHNNAGVKISSDGLIGNKIIVLDPGSSHAPVIQNGDVLHAEKILSTEEITKTLQENNINLLSITNDLKKVTKQMAEGKGVVGTLLSDSVLADKFRSIVQNLNATTLATQRMAGDLQKFGTKLNSKGTLADNLLTDTSTYKKLTASVNNLKQTTASAAQMVDNMNKASDKLNGTNSIIGVLLNDPKGAVKVQSSLNYLQEASIKLNDDLEAVQHNFFLKGFFKKREKAKADSIKAAEKSRQ